MSAEMVDQSSFLSFLYTFFSQSLIFIREIIAFVLFNGDIIIQKTFIFIVLAIILSIILNKMFNSSGMAFLISAIVSAVGVGALPDSVVMSIFTAVYAPIYTAVLVGIFILMIIFYGTPWWVRRLLLGIFIVAGAIKWYFYGRNIIYVVISAVCIVFLILDTPLQKLFIKIRNKLKENKSVSARQRIMAKKEFEAVQQGASVKEAEQYGREEAGLD